RHMISRRDWSSDVCTSDLIPLIPPASLKAEYPLSPAAYDTVLKGRTTIQHILDGTDKRLLVVVGPCSIHDVEAAHEYADKLVKRSEERRVGKRGGLRGSCT